MQLLWNLVSEMTLKYKNTIKGKYSLDKVDDVEIQGNKIRLLYREIYNNIDIKKEVSTITDKQINRCFLNFQKNNIRGFPQYTAFKALTVPIIKLFKPETEALLDQVLNILNENIRQISTKIFFRFPEMNMSVEDLCITFISQQFQKTKPLVMDLIQIEIDCIYTSNKHFMGLFKEIFTDDQDLPRNTRARIEEYVNIIKVNLRDSIPKSIGQFLVNESIDKMQIFVLDGFHKNEDLLVRMKEPPQMAEERKIVDQNIKILRKVITKLNSEGILDN